MDEGAGNIRSNIPNIPHIPDPPPEGMRKDWKPTNPKDVVGVRKVPFSCLPWGAISEDAVGMQEGGMKYGRHNYRDEGVLSSTYFDATMRHIVAWWEGEDMDPDSGLSHITKAITSLLVLRDAQMNGKCRDDRPIRMTDPDWLRVLNEKSSALVDKYPHPKDPFTHAPIRDPEVFPIDEMITIRNPHLPPLGGEPTFDSYGDWETQG